VTSVLIVSATKGEVLPSLDAFGMDSHEDTGFCEVLHHNVKIHFVITGAGMVRTAFELGKLAGKKFDLAVNAGVCGSFGKFKPGEVVRVESDRFPELGAEDDANFLTIDEIGLGSQTIRVQNPFRTSLTEKIPVATGITVNTVHGNSASIEKLIARIDADVESMEGAAFIHAANAFGWKALQLRAVSNIVEKRNRDAWKMDLAIGNLNKTIGSIIQSCS
jgi:futalosine hydrolase